jgi:penicillin V acylase-like amidase (Ntn superfamily)
MKKYLVLIVCIIYAVNALACSTFLLNKDGRYIFGRNYDWITGNGMVLINARGVAKTSFTADNSKTISWVSGYGSITFNQFGKEFPHGGMNEKGLVIELMWLDETSYPMPDSRAALSELQWIQYQLDNCATIQEVIATDKKIRIGRAGAAPLHYLIADATGHAATIEFINGKMTVHQGKELAYPVLTNTPYSQAIEQYNAQKGKQFQDNSLERFATACNMVQQFNTTNTREEPVGYAFSVLNKVAQPGYTKWSIVYDITNRQVYYTTSEQPQRKQFSFNEFDFSCKSTSLAFNLNSSGKGAISKQFTPLSFDQNKSLIERSAKECESRIKVAPVFITSAANYFNKVRCNRQ